MLRLINNVCSMVNNRRFISPVPTQTNSVNEYKMFLCIRMLSYGLISIGYTINWNSLLHKKQQKWEIIHSSVGHKRRVEQISNTKSRPICPCSIILHSVIWIELENKKATIQPDFQIRKFGVFMSNQLSHAFLSWNWRGAKCNWLQSNQWISNGAGLNDETFYINSFSANYANLQLLRNIWLKVH